MSTIRQIARLGDPVLREKTTPIDLPPSAAIRSLIEDMLATMRQANGVGIAAPQVSEPYSIFIVASRPSPRYPDAPTMEPEVAINPTIVSRSTELDRDWEGCLSIPGVRGLVPRHRTIRVRYWTLESVEVEREYSGFIARIFQHEEDHLRGILFLDRLEDPRDVVIEPGIPTPIPGQS